VHESEGSIAGDGEAVAAGFDGLLEPDGRQSVEGDVEAEADGIEASDNEDNGSYGYFEGFYCYSELLGLIST
jgi:hypothetical protein